MTEKLYYWAENLENYSSDNEQDYNQIIEIKRLNFFIGKNNAGKSRFLRSLFSNIYPNGIYLLPHFRKNIYILEKKLPDIDHQLNRNDVHSDLRHYLREIQKSLIGQRTNELIYLNSQIKGIVESKPIIKNYLEGYQLFELTHEDIQLISGLFKGRYYIPILRGMRPVTETENKQPYIERTQKDYFKDKEKFNSSNIITGECLYYELKVHLLGEPGQRKLIKEYEKKLSQYFFENDTVTLIPKFGKDQDGREIDIVHIKIGNDKQFPISELGDGLQQVIILTYEAFINKNETHAFFIEEPELHMHAGMVRQLMNFYLNETKHYYFFSTHSNHLLDMADESDQVIIQKFVKQPKENKQDGFDFKIYRCDRDHELLTSLGVKPSSVYLANCTIWVEGVTDRMYIAQYMEKYLQELLDTNGKAHDEIDKDFKKYIKYLGFMPNFHYAFVEYAGGNITHWSFKDNYPTNQEAFDFLKNSQGLTAKAITQNILLLADGDNEGKADRLTEWQNALHKENLYVLPCKEIENTLDPSIVKKACLIKFQGVEATHQQIPLHIGTNTNLNKKGFNARTDTSHFEINLLTNSIDYIQPIGIGRIIDDQIRKDKSLPQHPNRPRLFSDKSGTIDDKVSFCEISKVLMRYEDWKLTPKAKELCERIFQHIEKCNR
ncbi:AAA family ATPase [Acinetobacter bereziniae]|uniref:AAA family ATPase n=1 Tax=Acinetobacter bereziniae TaxID=106648 RepID=UPI00125017BB|nr:ATP-binding protein [Acinetobacter bereziniae]MDA3440252.1 ATP-binding protein [Acinetobacter bereziniae]